MSQSSNTSIVKPEAADGYVRAHFGTKTGTVTISCKVRGKKISTKLTIKKYENPVSSFKVGKTEYKGKFSKVTRYSARNVKNLKKQTITWKTKKIG